MKKIYLIFSMFFIAITLSACQTIFTIEDSNNEISYPQNDELFFALNQEQNLNYRGTIPLFLPNKERTKLISINKTLDLPINRHGAETVLSHLFNFKGDISTDSLSPFVPLSLSEYMPIEVSQGIATVNLTKSASNLTPRDLFIVSQSITNTLSSFTDISYVNILISGKPVSLDKELSLPMGTLLKKADTNIISLWEQVEHKKAAILINPEEKTITLPTTLYFPLKTGIGIMPEVRNITFDGITDCEFTTMLLSELSKGSNAFGKELKMPSFLDYLMREPSIDILPDNSGQKIILYFSSELYKAIVDSDNLLSTVIASLNMTLTTFIPDTSCVEIYIGSEKPIYTLQPQSPYILIDELIFFEGSMKRSDFTPFLLDYVELYYPTETGISLSKVLRPVPYNEVKNPYFILTQLFNGPKYFDLSENHKSFFATKTSFSDSHIMGIRYDDRQLSINLSQDIFEQFQNSISERDESLFIYGIVNSLCVNPAVDSINFFVAGKQPDFFIKDIYLPGYFLPNPGISQQ